MKSLQELMSLAGRTAVITGGAGRIGEAFCEVLAELGASICIFDVEAGAGNERADAVADRFRVRASAFVTDVAREESVQEAVSSAVAQFGGVDILINGAAYPKLELPEEGRELEVQSLARWNANLDVVLTGTFLMTRACAPHLRRRGRGSVINIASIYGLLGPDMRLYDGTDMDNPAYYAAGKGGIVQFTRYCATTLAPEVRVNCIAPGGVWRHQPESFHERYKRRTPLQRMASEEDLKGA
ncbi:MAG: SDR family NAD(P)-dependent oxidoreductase, partial [Acidobacteriaceae bacterium]|nr:SDR family NAD(P)-dependent oxidoreductase [Acidobacteriaceae bacterium]